jgi:hypothetical protein
VLDLKRWECGIPGKANTLWEGGLFKLDVVFPDGKPDCAVLVLDLYSKRMCAESLTVSVFWE